MIGISKGNRKPKTIIELVCGLYSTIIEMFGKNNTFSLRLRWIRISNQTAGIHNLINSKVIAKNFYSSIVTNHVSRMAVDISALISI